MDGDARRIDDSYERSVSGAHTDSGMDGLEIVGCSRVEGTVNDGSELVVGVTEDSVRLDIVESVRGCGGRTGSSSGDGSDKDGVEVKEGVCAMKSFGGTGGSSAYDRGSEETKDGLYTLGGSGTFCG